MSLVHVVLRPGTPRGGESSALSALFDILVDGVNITARAGHAQSLSLLAELASAVHGLRKGRASRATAQLCAAGDTWELGLEADGEDVLLSVFRTGPCPEVSVHERRVVLAELESALLEAIGTTLRSNLPAGHRTVLEGAERQLERGQRAAKPLPRALVQDRVIVTTQSGLEIQADAAFRLAEVQPGDVNPQLERADLHALLLPGKFRLSLGRRSLTVGRAHLFLLAERLLWLAEDGLESWQAARPLFRRLQVEGLRLGLRRGPGDAPLSISVSTSGEDGSPGKTLTLADLDTSDFVEATALFAESLCDRFVEHDPRQANNLRLGVLRENAKSLRARLAELRLDDAITNAEPDSYKSYGLPSVLPKQSGMWSEAGALRFAPRWVAAVPGVDLKATFLYGSHFIVGSARELASIHATTGEIVWRIHSERAATVSTPAGLARFHVDGRMKLHDFENGEVRYVVRLVPRSGGGAAGALVNTPGLPRLLLVAEGERAITAIDLGTGEVRWRHHAARAAHLRIRRAGRLALVSGGDSSLSALDVMTGEVVWRVRDRLPFTGDIAIRGDSAFAISSSPVGTARVHHIELWTGKSRWMRAIDDQPAPGHPPMVFGDSIVVPTRDQRGVGMIGLERETGAIAFELEPGLASAASAWLALEECWVINSASGTLLCLDSQTGEVLYNHVFSRHVESDLPRRLEPVLENGALFVPQNEVHVLRPKTGEMIGKVPCDLIPDLLRVDSACNVFIAEESGHIAAYSSAPQLQLVR